MKSKMIDDSENKHTNEKPVKIPLPFEEALAALLKVKPKPKEEKGMEQKESNETEPIGKEPKKVLLGLLKRDATDEEIEAFAKMIKKKAKRIMKKKSNNPPEQDHLMGA